MIGGQSAAQPLHPQTADFPDPRRRCHRARAQAASSAKRSPQSVSASRSARQAVSTSRWVMARGGKSAGVGQDTVRVSGGGSTGAKTLHAVSAKAQAVSIGIRCSGMVQFLTKAIAFGGGGGLRLDQPEDPRLRHSQGRLSAVQSRGLDAAAPVPAVPNSAPMRGKHTQQKPRQQRPHRGKGDGMDHRRIGERRGMAGSGQGPSSCRAGLKTG